MNNRTRNPAAVSHHVLALLLATTLAFVVVLLAVLPARAQSYDGLPTGNWRQYCINARMDGNELKAHCRNRVGAMEFVEANIRSCGGVVSYDISQTKFVCGYGGGSGYGGDGLPAGDWRQYCTNARMDGDELKAHCRNRVGAMVYVEANVASCRGIVSYELSRTKFVCAGSGGASGGTYGGSLPGGRWRQYCTNGYMDGYELKATCRRSDGSYRQTEANISACGGREIDYVISTGRFQCAGFAGPGHGSGGNAGFPAGTWSQSCSNASMQGPILRAQCRNNFGQLIYSQIDANQCYRGVWNSNGQLRCQ